MQNKDLFEPHGPSTEQTQHHIDTYNHVPIALPPYRLGPARLQLLRDEVDALLEQDIIEECESAWASPVVLVPKPNGKVRLCVDYRRLNAITKPDALHRKCPLHLDDGSKVWILSGVGFCFLIEVINYHLR